MFLSYQSFYKVLATDITSGQQITICRFELDPLFGEGGGAKYACTHVPIRSVNCSQVLHFGQLLACMADFFQGASFPSPEAGLGTRPMSCIRNALEARAHKIPFRPTPILNSYKL